MSFQAKWFEQSIPQVSDPSLVGEPGDQFLSIVVGKWEQGLMVSMRITNLNKLTRVTSNMGNTLGSPLGSPVGIEWSTPGSPLGYPTGIEWITSFLSSSASIYTWHKPTSLGSPSYRQSFHRVIYTWYILIGSISYWSFNAPSCVNSAKLVSYLGSPLSRQLSMAC